MLIAEHQISPAMIFLGGILCGTRKCARRVDHLLGGANRRSPVGGHDCPLGKDQPRPRTAHRKTVRALGRRPGAGRARHTRNPHPHQHPGGMARMSFITFFTATFVGAYLWCTVLIGAGYVLGHEWAISAVTFKQSLPYLLGGGAMALALYFWITQLPPPCRITRLNPTMITTFIDPPHEWLTVDSKGDS